MDRIDQARLLVEAVVASFASEGPTLFDCRVGRAQRALRLHVTLDRPGAAPGRGVSHEDCIAVTRRIKQALAERLEEIDYHLEVSSPGVERPLRGPEDFQRFAGQRIRLTEERAEGRVVVRGQILEAHPENGLHFHGDGDEARWIPWTGVASARLTLD